MPQVVLLCFAVMPTRQADFGEAIGVIGGVERKIHFFAMDLPYSDAIFVAAYPAETTEAFCDGHLRAIAFFGGVPQSILYDNTKIAVVRILGDGQRRRTRVFSELQSHYLFEDRFGWPGKGNDKGKVEGLVGYARRNFLVPIPVFESFEALNAHLMNCCRRRLSDCLRGQHGTIGERLERDLAAFQTPLPAPYDACEKVTTQVSSLALVRYRCNDYSAPTAYGYRKVLVRGYVHEVVITCGAEIIARHPRSYEREDFVFNPLHYLALIEQRINALDQAAPLAGWQLPEEFATLRRLLEARMGKKGKREFVQALRLMEVFRIDDVPGPNHSLKTRRAPQPRNARQARRPPISRAFLLASVLHFYSGKPLQIHSGVDSQTHIARRKKIAAGQTIITEEESVEFFANITFGAVQLTKTLPDGRQHIVAMLLAPDCFGRA